VTAAAVILPQGLYIEGLDDSKKLSEAKREQLYDIITKESVAFAVCHATVEEMNQTDILSATLLAMRRAIDSLSVNPSLALIDGNVSRGFTLPVRTVVHGDAVSPSIAAASILAKVTRDRICYELDAMYPEYGIAKHKGYGTKAHREALIKYGPAPIYRTKFIRFLDKETKA
jgi:ribonuclease HII